jgi:hypothetical protein
VCLARCRNALFALAPGCHFTAVQSPSCTRPQQVPRCAQPAASHSTIYILLTSPFLLAVRFAILMQQAALDAFETLSLGPGAPTVPGQAADGGANPAAFPRPAGPAAEAQVGPPEPYSPYNCKPEFVRMTSHAVPNSQVRRKPALPKQTGLAAGLAWQMLDSGVPLHLGSSLGGMRVYATVHLPAWT